jgi:hypothetical protein
MGIEEGKTNNSFVDLDHAHDILENPKYHSYEAIGIAIMQLGEGLKPSLFKEDVQYWKDSYDYLVKVLEDDCFGSIHKILAINQIGLMLRTWGDIEVNGENRYVRQSELLKESDLYDRTIGLLKSLEGGSDRYIRTKAGEVLIREEGYGVFMENRE